jgi:hypothetical protein
LDELEETPVGPDTDQSATPPLELTYFEYHPFFNLLAESQREMMFQIGRDGGGVEFWHQLDRWVKVEPTIRLLSSEALRKERSQVRILRAKSRFIKTLERLITNPTALIRE